MPLDHEKTIRRAREQGLYDEYQTVMNLIHDAAALENSRPQEALKAYTKANDILEATGAPKTRGGGPNHALFELHQGNLYRAGELMRRTGVTL